MEELKALQEENERLKNYIEILENQVKTSEYRVNEMSNSFSWKITKPVRYVKAHCGPAGCGVDFLRSLKKQGFSATMQENKIKKYQKKHRYSAKILPSEYKKQKEKRKDIATKYVVFIRLYEENPADYEKMLEQIAGQSIAPDRIFVFSESVSRSIREITLDGIPVACMEKDDIKILMDSIQDDMQVICIENYAFLSQNCIYEFEVTGSQNDCVIGYCDDAIEYGDRHYDYRYKPDYAPHYLEAENYIGNVICLKGGCLKKVMVENPGYLEKEVSFVYSILLDGSFSIYHISDILCGIPQGGEEQLKREAVARARYWKEKGSDFHVEKGLFEGTAHIKKTWEKEPYITIMIPTCDHIDDLQKCIQSILHKSTYHNYEILLIENNSKEEQTLAYYKQLETMERIRIITWEGEFNYSAINNFGLSHVKGEYVVLLNNDIEVIEPDWLQEMLFYACRKEVGAVGAKLYFPDDTIQHAGVILGIRRLAGHANRNLPGKADGYMHRLKVIQDYSVVTAACLMVSMEKIKECRGFDEQLAVDYNDVDLCMKLRKLGYYNVFTPYARLYHYESKSRGENISPEKMEQNGKEFFYFTTKWYQSIVQGDPFYNKHLTLEDDSFSFK